MRDQKSNKWKYVLVFLSLVLLTNFVKLTPLQADEPSEQATIPLQVTKEQGTEEGEKYLIIKADGRLGNQMFEWFSAKAIAAKNGAIACGIHFNNLKAAFVISVPPCPDIDVEVIKHGEKGYATYQEFTITQSTHLEHTYLQSFKYYDGYNLTDEIRFKDFWLTQVREFFKSIEFDSAVDVLVAIHVRRGDIATAKWSWHIFPPDEYFIKAIEHFEAKYDNVKFIVATNGYEWAMNKTMFQKKNVFFTGSKSHFARDFAILSHCNHTVTSLGTYGWWVGYITGGDVFYYYDQFNWKHSIPKNGLTPEDFWPPYWFKVTKASLFPSSI